MPCHFSPCTVPNKDRKEERRGLATDRQCASEPASVSGSCRLCPASSQISRGDQAACSAKLAPSLPRSVSISVPPLHRTLDPSLTPRPSHVSSTCKVPNETIGRHVVERDSSRGGGRASTTVGRRLQAATSPVGTRLLAARISPLVEEAISSCKRPDPGFENERHRANPGCRSAMDCLQ